MTSTGSSTTAKNWSNLHVRAGHLGQEQAGRIQNAIVERWYRDQKQRQRSDERQAVQRLMQLDPSW